MGSLRGAAGDNVQCGERDRGRATLAQEKLGGSLFLCGVGV